jgi:hypothetical protein
MADGEITASRKKYYGRPKGYAPWKPQKKTVVILEQVQEILQEYRNYLPLTIRQVFYILVGNYYYPKDERAYERLCTYLNRARRAGIIEFNDLRDDGISVIRSDHYAGANDFYARIKQMGQGYKRDKLANQNVDVGLFCEAAGMMPQLHRVADKYSIPVYSCSGFDSLTAKYELARSITEEFTYEGKSTVVLHLGDYDPSGVSIYESMQEDVLAFVDEDVLSKPPDEVAIFKRVALNPDHIDEHELTTYPAKASDGRSKAWLEEGRETCQLEALPPDILADELGDAIEGVLNEDQLKTDRKEEEKERQEITKALPSGGED